MAAGMAVAVVAPCTADRPAAAAAAVFMAAVRMAAGTAAVRMATGTAAAGMGAAGTVDSAALTGTSTWARRGTRRWRGDIRATTRTMTAEPAATTTIRRPRTGGRPTRRRDPA